MVEKKETIKKRDLARTMSTSTGLTINDCCELVDIITNAIGKGLKDDKEVLLRGFGRFFTRYHKGKRFDFNKESIVPFEANVVHFKASKDFKNVVNEKND